MSSSLSPKRYDLFIDKDKQSMKTKHKNEMISLIVNCMKSIVKCDTGSSMQYSTPRPPHILAPSSKGIIGTNKKATQQKSCCKENSKSKGKS